MKKTLFSLVLVAGIGAAVWFGLLQRDQPATARQGPEALYDFEAQGVVLRQMDADGRLQYEIQAEQIVQLPGNGGIRATKPVFHHDPPGVEPGGPKRWTLTAEEGTFPAGGRAISLSGQVVVQGTPRDSNTPLRLAANELVYDMEREQATAAGEVEITAGRNSFGGRGMRVNVATGRVELESSTHAAKISL